MLFDPIRTDDSGSVSSLHTISKDIGDTEETMIDEVHN